jgi:hypothetical protein
MRTVTDQPADADDGIRLINGRRMQCKDIPDGVFLGAVRRTPWKTPSRWRMSWHVHEELEQTVGPVPVNLFRAKARRLCARGLLGGCPCGCRGDLHLPGECEGGPTCCRDARTQV